LVNKEGSWKNKQYNKITISWVNIGEILLTGYFSYGIYLSFKWDDFAMFPFFLMLALGFGTISFLSIKHSYAK